MFNDRIEFWAAENVTRDSNVLRLSDRVSPTVIGALRLSDTISTTHVGVNVDVPWSQQRVQLAYDGYASRYRNFKDLNNNGYVVRAQLFWGILYRVSGTAGYSEARGLSSFANIQSRVRDLIITRQAWFTGAWQATPRWRATTALATMQNKHSEITRRINDIETSSGELGLAYVTPLENAIGAVGRFETGRLPTGTTLRGVPFDNEYQQYGLGGTVNWVISGHSRLEGRAEWVRRLYEQATERNYSGPILRALYTWTPTAKLSVVASVQREFGPADDIQASFVLLKGGYIRPRWAATEKITVQGNLERNVYDYRGDPLIGANFTHRVRIYGLGVTYRPLENVLLGAGYNREVRTSTADLGDYKVNVAHIEGRVGF